MHALTKTTLVLLPGLDGTEVFFGPLLAELPPWVEPVVVTYPATGPNAYDDLVPIVNRAVESLPDFVIFGWSFGGPLALMVAAQRRSQVGGLVLCASFVRPPHPGLIPFRFAITPPVIAAIRAMRRTRLLIPGNATAEMRKAKAATWRKVNARVLATRARAAMGVDVRRLLADCRARILYLAATKDEIIPRSSLDEVLAIAPKTQVARIEGPHLALFTNPVQSAARIADFLRCGRPDSHTPSR